MRPISIGLLYSAMAARMLTDAMVRALAVQERRDFLSALQQYDSTKTTDLRNLLPPNSDDRGLQVRMYHTHLPLLDDLGYVKWDSKTNEVGKGVRFEELKPILRLESDSNSVALGQQGNA